MDAAAKLKSPAGGDFEYLDMIMAVDYPHGFELVYRLVSLKTNQSITLKTRLSKDDPSVPSLTSLWKGADWLERETFDLVGIKFTGHPNLIRILLPDGWNGHPLRKDYDMDTEQFITIGEDGDDIVSPDGTNLLRRK